MSYKQVHNYPVIKISADDLKNYVGKYELASNFYIDIFIKINTLYTEISGQDKDKYRYYEKDKIVLKTIK